MFEGEGITEYIKKYLSNDALTIYSIRDNKNISKEQLASDLLKNGISLTNNILFKNILSPKGLVRDIKSLEDTITYKTFYHEKDICNIIISTPQVIDMGNEKYFIGYPKDNVSGYTTAEHQKDYDCFLTDYLEKVKKVFNNMIVGYYYEDKNGKKYFKSNESHYSKLKEKEKNDFFTGLLEKVDNKITNRSDKKEILNYIKDTILDNKCDFNPKYLTALEYLEYSDHQFINIEYDRKKFVNLVKSLYKDYSLYLHGVDQETPKAAKDTCDHILRKELQLDWEYSMKGSVEPKGPVDENDTLYEDLDYHYHGNDKEDYNIIILIPKVLEDMDRNSYFIGYSRRNTTGSMPKAMTDFDCLASDIINDIGCIPRELIFAYQVFGDDVKEKFFINTKHISFLSDDLQRIICTKILNRSYSKLREDIKTFSLDKIDMEKIEAYRNPLIKTRVKSSMQTTAEEFFEYLDNDKQLRDFYLSPEKDEAKQFNINDHYKNYRFNISNNQIHHSISDEDS